MKVVGIGGMAVTEDSRDVLITYSLGSCIGVSAWDPTVQIGGLIHCLLPCSARGGGDATDEGPARFVDRGVVALLRDLYERGARRENLIIKVAGAGHPLEGCQSFRIGERNHAALRKVLWKNNLLIASERIGGSQAKTLTLHVLTGQTLVRSKGEEEEI